MVSQLEVFRLWNVRTYQSTFVERRKPAMKYIAPEMKVLAFAAEEAVAAALEGSKLFNDGELEW